MTLYFSEDIKEFLENLYKFSVKYLIVGGEAVIFYGYPRLTGDVDIFYECEISNIENLYKALNAFWDNSIPGIKSCGELLEPGLIVQFGVPPNRIDLINKISGISFQEAWKDKITVKVHDKDLQFDIYYIGKKELIKNKTASARPKDLEDLKFLN